MKTPKPTKSQKRTVLFLASFFPTRVAPIKGPFIRNFADVISNTFNLIVLTIEADYKLPNGSSVEKTEVNNFTQYTVFYNPNYVNIPVLKSFINFYNFFFGVLRAYQQVKQENGNIDLHHLHSSIPLGIFALYLKFLKRTPYVFSEQVTIYIYDRYRRLPFYNKWLHRQIFKNASAISGLTRYHAREIIKCGLTKNVSVIPNVIDINNYACKSQINTTGLIKWVHMSTLSPVKGVEDQIRALSLVLKRGFSVEFTIIGGDETRIQELKLLAKECGVENQIKWTGWMIRNEFVPILKSSDLFLLNSEFETFCVVAAEALACGIPVVCPSIGPLKEFIHDSNGVFFEERNPEKMAEALILCMQQLNKYSPTIISKEIQEKFGPDNVLNSFKELYKTIDY